MEINKNHVCERVRKIEWGASYTREHIEEKSFDLVWVLLSTCVSWIHVQFDRCYLSDKFNQFYFSLVFIILFILGALIVK